MFEVISTINEKHNNSILDVVKISIIILASIFLFANFSPYIHGGDGFLYGISAIDLAHGSYGFTNKFLQEGAGWEFLPNQYVKTIHNTAIPIGSVGIYGIATLAYLIGGNYGLFYLVPIITVLLIIFSERIATNLFGRFVGFITLVLISTDVLIFEYGTKLLTDNIFTLLFLFGCFYLIKFLRYHQEKYILFSTIFFVSATFLRYNGVIIFPIEIIFVIGNFIIYQRNRIKNQTTISQNSQNILSLRPSTKHQIKTGFFISIPWIFFFLFMLSYNQYFFDELFTTYYEQSPWPKNYERGSFLTVFEFNDNRFDWIKFYSPELFPDKILLDLNIFLLNILGVFSAGLIESIVLFMIISIVLIISFNDKNKRTEFLVFTIMILGFILLFSSNFVTSLGGTEIRAGWDRYMIPTLPLSFMMFGFIINRIWQVNLKNNKYNIPNWLHLIIKIGFFVLIFYFLGSSIYDSIPIQNVLNSTFSFTDPRVYASGNPFSEEIPKGSIVFGSSARTALAYDGIPLYPYWGYWPLIREEWNPDLIDQQPIQTLKDLVGQGHQAFVYKTKTNNDVKYFQYLESEHGIILKNYSLLFCKIELLSDFMRNDAQIPESDDNCYGTSQLSFTKPIGNHTLTLSVRVT